MKARKRFIGGAWMCLLVLLALSPLAGQEDPGLRVGLMHFPPFSDVSDPAHPKGLFYDMIALSLEKAEVNVASATGFPARRHYAFLGSGETQFSIGAKYVGNLRFRVEKDIKDLELE